MTKSWNYRHRFRTDGKNNKHIKLYHVSNDRINKYKLLVVENYSSEITMTHIGILLIEFENFLNLTNRRTVFWSLSATLLLKKQFQQCSVQQIPGECIENATHTRMTGWIWRFKCWIPSDYSILKNYLDLSIALFS